MEDNWVTVFNSGEQYRCERVVTYLEKEGIQAVVFSKRDTVNHFLNQAIDYQVLVKAVDVIKANHVINQTEK